MFTDPDGRDITYAIWEDGKTKPTIVEFNQLDKNIQKALEAFAKTEVGYQFLEQFANKGDKIGSVEFNKTGDNSKHEMQFGQFTDGRPGIAPGYNGVAIGEDKLTFYTKINTENENGKNPEAYAVTLGHESFIHQDQFSNRMISAHNMGDKKALNDIRFERGQISRDGLGKPEHLGYLNKNPSYNKMYKYWSQLKSKLNPTEVNIQIKKHDEKLKKVSSY